MLTTDVACSINEFARYFIANSQAKRLFLSSPQINISFNADNASEFSAWVEKRAEMDEESRVIMLRQFTHQAAVEADVEIKNVAIGVLDFGQSTITFLAPKQAKQTYAERAVAGVTITPPSDLNFVAIEQLSE